QEPGQVRVDTDEHGDAIEVEHERDEKRQQRVQAEQRRESKKDAECEGRRSPLGRVLDVQQVAEPLPDEAAGEANHRKCVYPRGKGASAVRSPTTRRSRTARSAVHTPTRVIDGSRCRAAAFSRARSRGRTVKSSS